MSQLDGKTFCPRKLLLHRFHCGSAKSHGSFFIAVAELRARILFDDDQRQNFLRRYFTSWFCSASFIFAVYYAHVLHIPVPYVNSNVNRPWLIRKKRKDWRRESCVNSSADRCFTRMIWEEIPLFILLNYLSIYALSMRLNRWLKNGCY